MTPERLDEGKALAADLITAAADAIEAGQLDIALSFSALANGVLTQLVDELLDVLAVVALALGLGEEE